LGSELNPSEVSESLEAPAQEESQPLTSLLVEAPPDPVGLVSSNPSWLRLAYSVEFILALIAIISLWSEIGGEGHLDLMPWYIKLGCILGLAWCSVRFTASIVEQQKVWTRRTLGWFAGILLFCVVMGGITYYYHLHEQQDDDDDDTSAATASVSSPGIFFL
jgi:hypothetical protein